MKHAAQDEIRQQVRKTYGDIARNKSVGSCGSSSCCGTADTVTAKDISMDLGYSQEDVDTVPDGANMGLGCGNPQAIAALRPGETVVDLGSGGGFDCFLAARAVGEKGAVIGVDMTPDMISKARANAEKTNHTNVEFRLGEIEHLPIADNTANVIISNCVINLSPDKQSVYNEIFRVLKKGGRVAVSDIVALKEIPGDIQKDMELYAGCVAGASTIDDLEAMLRNAGFSNIRIKIKKGSKEVLEQWMPGKNIGQLIASAAIEAMK